MGTINKKAKIIATMGPAIADKEKISLMVENGVDLFRLNFSHGSLDLNERYISLIEEVSAELNKKTGIIADLQGPKIRTGRTFNNQTVVLKEGDTVILTTKEAVCTDKIIFVAYPPLCEEIKTGDPIKINDGIITLNVSDIDIAKKEVLCRIARGGWYSSHKGVSFPNSHISLQSLTEKDYEDIEFILNHHIDFLALSFVKSADDIMMLRGLTNKKKKTIRLIAKIEKAEGVKAIDAILDVCDGILIARGDLGIEVPLDTVPLIQKDLIVKAWEKKKTVIVATQMLESMIESAMPTRAEITDIANAVIDGADALMLSGETSVGKYPVESVSIMSQVIKTTEESSYFNKYLKEIKEGNITLYQAVCLAAVHASRYLNNIPIVVFTLSGDTAWYLSKLRPVSPIVAFSSSPQVVSQLSLAWNTTPFLISFEDNLIKLISMAEDKLIKEKIVSKGDMVVLISGTSPVKGAANFIRIKKIGEQ